MRYLVVLKDGRFAADPKARKFAREYPDAHQFDKAGDAFHVAKMLNMGDRLKAHAISVKAYEEGERDEGEPDDDYFERAAERADLDTQSSDQDLIDAGRGHLVRP